MFMQAHKFVELATVLLLFGSLSSVQRAAGVGAGGECLQTGVAEPQQNKLPVGTGNQEKLHLRSVEASERAERDAAAMVPGRTWTWRLDFEQSRQLLDQLRRDLTALGDSEADFEASLTSEQKSKVQAELKSLQELWQHLESDAQSLDLELREGYPTRWHVARDASDMQKEIRNWRKLHQQVATAVGANRRR